MTVNPVPAPSPALRTSKPPACLFALRQLLIVLFCLMQCLGGTRLCCLVSVPLVWPRDSMATDVQPVLRDTRANTVRGQTRTGSTTHTHCTMCVMKTCNRYPHRPGVPLVTMATHRCQEASARSVSVRCGGHCQDRVTHLQANATAGSGHWERRATSAWTGMCVDPLGSSVRLTHSFFYCYSPVTVAALSFRAFAGSKGWNSTELGSKWNEPVLLEA